MKFSDTVGRVVRVGNGPPGSFAVPYRYHPRCGIKIVGVRLPRMWTPLSSGAWTLHGPPPLMQLSTVHGTHVTIAVMFMLRVRAPTATRLDGDMDGGGKR